MGQRVTVISSGINAQSAALCTLEVLSCATHIKEFIYQGTAGFSPAVSLLHLFSLEMKDLSRDSKIASKSKIICIYGCSDTVSLPH